MSSIESLILESSDPAAATGFYDAAFGLGGLVTPRSSDAPTSGFRGFAVSLVVAQPGTVDSLVRTALEAGATTVKPASKSFWGYGAVLCAPDGALWKIATSAKKDTRPPNREVDDVVLLLGVADVKATKQFYRDQGLSVSRSFGSKYVEFETAPVKLGLYSRRAAAKDLGVAPEGTGSHRLAIVGDPGTFADPDGFPWEVAAPGSDAAGPDSGRGLTQQS